MIMVMFTAVADHGGRFGPFLTNRTLVFNTQITTKGGNTSGKHITLTMSDVEKIVGDQRSRILAFQPHLFYSSTDLLYFHSCIFANLYN